MAELTACKTMVALLSPAHDRACEAQLASVLSDDLEHRRLPDLSTLLARFAPDPARLPEVSVQLAPLCSYDILGIRCGPGRRGRGMNDPAARLRVCWA